MATTDEEAPLTLDEYVRKKWGDLDAWMTATSARLDAADAEADTLRWWQTSVNRVLLALVTGQSTDEFIPWLRGLEDERKRRVAAYKQEPAQANESARLAGAPVRRTIGGNS